jgi:adenylate kinase
MVCFYHMLNLLLIGPQGSGKGTQADKIVGQYGLTHIEMGSLIRARAKVHDQKAEIIDHLANKKGLLLPDGIVLDMISDELTDKPSAAGYLFDGFPRTVNQYQALKQLLEQKNLSLNAAIYLSIPDAESVKRLSSRRICEKCGKGYSLFLQPDLKVCTCGGQLISRADDTEAAILKRLKLFHESTQPILELLGQDNLLITIDGTRPVADITQNIIRELRKRQQ